MPPSIRKMAPHDYFSVSQIIHSVQTAAKYSVGPCWSLEQIRAECEQGGWVLVDAAGEVEAFVLIRQITESTSEITFLATRPDATGRGRMKRLLETVIKQELVGQEVWLEVHEANLAAKKLYASVGFRQTGSRPNYYPDGGTAVLYNYG